jgi:hypothetical protein
LLLVVAEPFFKILLGPAATMPATAVWVIIALIFGNLTIVSFMATYAAVYICGALLQTLFAIRGAIRLTRRA